MDPSDAELQEQGQYILAALVWIAPTLRPSEDVRRDVRRVRPDLIQVLYVLQLP